MICNGMKSLLNEQVLLAWFVDNYMRKCATHCPEEVSVLFADLSSCEKFQRAVDALVNWKVSAASQELCNRGYAYEIMMLSFVIMYGADATMTRRLTEENQVSDRRLRDYLTGVIILRVACTISMSSLTDDILDMMWTLFDPGSAADSYTSMKFDSQGLVTTRKAITLARLSNVHSDALEMLHNELSKAYLHHALTFEHGSAYVQCVVHVLLATLYYKSGDYQRVVHHCNQVLNNQDCSLCRIRAEHVPQIDECVDSIFGLFLLYQHVQREVLISGVEPHQHECKPVFTIPLLAQYLYSNCSAYSRGSEMTKYLLHLSRPERSPLCDVLLLKQMKLHFDECKQAEVVYTRTNNSTTNSIFDTSLLVIMLELVALEKLITFRQSLVHELHSEKFPVLNEFEALYAYKCGMFKECMEMCRNHANMMLHVSCSMHEINLF